MLLATDLESYPEDECIWIPTAEQNKKGFEEIGWSIGDVTYEDDAERLFVSYMESIKKSEIQIRKNGQKNNLTGV